MIQIHEDVDDDWEFRGNDLSILENDDAKFIVFVSEEINEFDKGFKLRFQEEFWPVLDGDINGSFHCEYTCEGPRVWPSVSWACFKVKEVKTANDYGWKQPTIHVQWDAKTGRQVVHVFGLSEDQRDNLLREPPTAKDRKCNPFSWHATFARIILKQYDGAFWLLRDLVRSHEKERSKSPKTATMFPSADIFLTLHDVARHIFHYQETIEVAERTLEMLALEQVRWREEDDANIRDNLETWMNTRQRILFQEKGAHSLKTRSRSLNERHLNEIKLAFNLVSQGFGRAARSDSNMMKTVAVVSMVYLPGTFVSGLFGTNFFSFQAEPGNTWLTADEFWLYWAVTIPLTLLTLGIWALWHWRDIYDLWRRLTSSNKSDNPDASMGTPPNGSSSQVDVLRSLRRMTTKLRMSEVQRKETV
ncbi:hypothetical protein BJX76DRAFT_362627 [Aspergillus varians]